MAYSFQTFSYLQVLTSVQANQIEENILKHEHGVTTNCQVLSLYAALSENETITGQWTFAPTTGNTIFSTGDVRIGTASAALTLGGIPGTNGSGALNFVNSNSLKNWQIGFNQIVSGNLEIIPSAAAGGSTFTSPLVSFQPSGAPIVLGSTTMCTNLNADCVDGYHAGNATASVPISNGTLNTNLNADFVDGYHAGNNSGRIPISNSTICLDLNADMVDGLHGVDILGKGTYQTVTFTNIAANSTSSTSAITHGLGTDNIAVILVSASTFQASGQYSLNWKYVDGSYLSWSPGGPFSIDNPATPSSGQINVNFRNDTAVNLTITFNLYIIKR